MRRIVNVLLVLVLLTFSSNAFSQQYKFGHVESQRIVILMPEYTKASDSLNTVKSRYDEQAERMQVEINRKYNELVEQQSELDSLILESMFTEVQSMQERLQNFQVQANQKLRTLEGNLLQSVMDKLDEAIGEVAKELDLIYVFDVSARNPVYASDKSIDVGPMVKEKLGIN
jgi:outer membrane protein